MTKSATLLIEILTEELPPLALEKLGQSFAQSVLEQLQKQNFTSDQSMLTAFASPRRLACTITNINSQSPDQKLNTRLLPAKVGLDENGKPTAPLNKKLAALNLENISIEQLERVNDGKQDMLHITHTVKGQTLAAILTTILEVAVHQLPIPKVMSYQRANGDTIHFARPAHKLLVLHDDEVISASVLGLTSDRKTMGHRFLSKGEIEITSADNYEIELEKQGRVIASFSKRQQRIVEQLDALAKQEEVIKPATLVNEVTALVEWPVTYEGYFDQAFLAVPQECLILTMQANQKYFALTKKTGEICNRFLLVSNIETTRPSLIINGNERVLRARLADAKFFFDQDKKSSLESRLPKLSAVIYHNKLGDQQERNHRIVNLADQLATACNANPESAKRAALLSKADLLTEMVGEFPELQGTMGEYYAKHDREPEEVALAIADHYCPRFAGDNLPRNPEGLTVALADKLETLVGIFGIGLIPTGDKDPFALRRHALGIIRILIENKLPLNVFNMLEQTSQLFTHKPAFKPCTQDILKFIFDRLKSYLRDLNYTANEINSVLSERFQTNTNSQFFYLNTLIDRLNAVRAFCKLPEAQSLAETNKRITNILKKVDKNTFDNQHENFEVLTEPVEIQLLQKHKNLLREVDSAFNNKQYQMALELVAPLKKNFDVFFEQVMVMADDEELRQARLHLLVKYDQLMNKVADISRLAA